MNIINYNSLIKYQSRTTLSTEDLRSPDCQVPLSLMISWVPLTSRK